ETDTRILDELRLCRGTGRIDIAVLNGETIGFEIKSTRDTLNRLPRQVEIYGAIFDRLTLVTSSCHLTEARDLIPAWWGIELALPGKRVTFETVREAEWNYTIDPGKLVELLWRDEALLLLEKQGHDRGLRSKPRRHLCEKLASTSASDDLRLAVREAMKA